MLLVKSLADRIGFAPLVIDAVFVGWVRVGRVDNAISSAFTDLDEIQNLESWIHAALLALIDPHQYRQPASISSERG